MMNIYDYLKWRGDLSFKADPFNIVDSLLFSYIIYTDFREVLWADESITLEEAARRLFEIHTEEELLNVGSLIDNAPIVMRRMSETKRFRNVRISHYINRVDEKYTEQFSAAHFEIDPHTSYISLCGTDDTMVGWKEDFKMSYETIAAQKSSADYVNTTASKLFHKYYIGGHSKGGNLAYYAGMMAKPAVKKKIINVYSFDGPALAQHTIDLELYGQIKDRMIKVIPEFSVFGLLYDTPVEDGKTVVKSSSNLFWEHDPVSWQVIANDFEKGSLSKDCLLIQDGLYDFLDTMNIEQRKNFVDEVFRAFDKAGIKKVSNITRQTAASVMKIMREMVHVSDDTKKAFVKLVQIYGSIISEKAEGAIKTMAKEKYEILTEFIKAKTKKQAA